MWQVFRYINFHKLGQVVDNQQTLLNQLCQIAAIIDSIKTRLGQDWFELLSLIRRQRRIEKAKWNIETNNVNICNNEFDKSKKARRLISQQFNKLH